MPITTGARKKLRQDKKRQAVNLKAKNTVKRAIKKFKLSPSEKQYQEVQRLLDRALKKNIYHKNKVARLKSSLSKVLPKKAPASQAKGKAAKKSSK